MNRTDQPPAGLRKPRGIRPAASRLLQGRGFLALTAVVGLASLFWHQYLLRRVELRDLYFLTEVAAYHVQGDLPCWGRELAYTGFRTGSLEYLIMLMPLQAGWGLAGLLWLLSFLWAAGVALTTVMLRRAISPATGLLGGFLLLNADPFLKYQLRFQNNTILPAFTAAVFFFLLPALVERRISHSRAAGLGLACGASVQIHPAAGLILLLGAAFWLVRRVRTGVWGLICLTSAALLPWIPFLIGEITTGFVNLRRLWISGLADHIPLAASEWPRLISWVQLFFSPPGIIALATLLLLAVAFLGRRRLRWSRRVRLTTVFCLVQIAVPLMLYDFPKKPLFLLFFEPTVAILTALTPWLLTAVPAAWGPAETKLPAVRRTLFLALAAATLLVPVSRHFPIRGDFDRANAVGFRMGVADRAAALGVPYDTTWEDRFHGPFQLAERECWDFIRAFHARSYDDAADNDVLILPATATFDSPPERRLTYADFQLIAIPRLVVDRRTTINQRDDLMVAARILPGGAQLYLQYANKHIDGPVGEPQVQIDGVYIKPDEAFTYQDKIETIAVCRFALTPAAGSRELRLRLPRGARAARARVLDLFVVDRLVPFPPGGPIPRGGD